MTTRESNYFQVMKERAYEVRDYPSLNVPEMVVTGDSRQASRMDFRRLAADAVGGNAGAIRIAMADLPEPNDRGITLKVLATGRYAVVRFSGFASKAKIAAMTQKLLTTATAQGFEPTGPVLLALSNMPWTPWFMRRNEVMVPVGVADSGSPARRRAA